MAYKYLLQTWKKKKIIDLIVSIKDLQIVTLKKVLIIEKKKNEITNMKFLFTNTIERNLAWQITKEKMILTGLSLH